MDKFRTPSWTEIAARPWPPVLLVPVGAWEQHGPHLPLDTDTRIAVAVAERAQQLLGTDAIVTAALGITASGEHAAFPGTLSIGTAAMEELIVELGRSADWSAGVVLVNGHGGNAAPVRRAVARLADEGRRAVAWWPSPDAADPLPADAHAGHVETSVMLAIDPGAVRQERIASGSTAPLAEIADTLRRDGVRAVSPSGVLGDPTGASAERGHRLLAHWAADLAAVTRSLLDRSRPG